MIADRMAKQYEALLALDASNSPATNKATLTINPAGANNALKFTAVNYGDSGNDITVAYTNPGGTNPLVVTVTGTAISVQLQTIAAAIVSTANDVKTAVNDHAAASALVLVTLDTVDGGNTGAGTIPAAVAATSLSGGLHGTYSFIVHEPEDEALTIPMAGAAEDMDTLLTVDQMVRDMPIWANMISALRKHLNDQGVASLIDGLLSSDSVRVHEYFDQIHYLTIGNHLLGVNVFTPTVQDMAVVTAAASGYASLTLNPVGAKASVTIDPTGADNALLYTAVTSGVAGNAISVQYTNPGISNTLSVEVQGDNITVKLGTNGSGVITSTAGDILTAVNAHTEAAALVLVTAPGASTGLVTEISQTYLTNRNTSLTYTALEAGSEGNEITVAYINPGVLTASTTVAVTTKAIAVTLAHDGTNITATAAAVKSAVEGSADAAALVSVTANGTVTGVVSAVSATALDGGCEASITSTDHLGAGTGEAGDNNHAAQNVQVEVTPAVTAATLDVYPSSAKAFVTLDPGGLANSRIKFTAVTGGTAGNDITIALTYTQLPSLAIAVTVNGNAISVRLATNSGSAITSTIANVITAIAGSGAAAALVVATAVDTSTNVIDAPVAATSLTNTRTKVRLTAVAAGAAGDSIRIRLINPGALTVATTSSTAGNDISVTLAHDGTNITATAANVRTALLADGAATALVNVTAITPEDGIVAALGYTNLSGGSGPTLKRDTTLNLTMLKSDLSSVTRTVEFSSGAAAGTTVSVGAQSAYLLVDPTGSNNAVLFTAVAAGTGGNSITIKYTDPGLPDATASVSVVSNAITVNLETDHNARIVTTADEIVALIAGSGAASALVTAVAYGNGHGYVAATNATNLAGGYAAERFFKVTAATMSGGENGDVFTVNNVPERSITY